MSSVVDQATAFLSACYGQHNCETMSDARLKVWAAKTGKGYTSTPKLHSLPPTTESFRENVKRAHYQAYLWRTLESVDVQMANPEQYGWKKDEPSISLLPITLPENVPLAPAAVMSLIRCGCASDPPCGSMRCGVKVQAYRALCFVLVMMLAVSIRTHRKSHTRTRWQRETITGSLKE